MEKKEVGKDGDLITAEEVEKGYVGIEDVNEYLAYAFGGWSYVGYFAFSIISSVLQLGTTYFVALWASQDHET